MYDFPGGMLIKTIKCYNPNGIVAVSSNDDFNYLAFVERNPSKKVVLEDNLYISYIPDYISKKESPNTIWSNKCDINHVSFNPQGNALAVACQGGT